MALSRAFILSVRTRRDRRRRRSGYRRSRGRSWEPPGIQGRAEQIAGAGGNAHGPGPRAGSSRAMTTRSAVAATSTPAIGFAAVVVCPDVHRSAWREGPGRRMGRARGAAAGSAAFATAKASAAGHLVALAVADSLDPRARQAWVWGRPSSSASQASWAARTQPPDVHVGRDVRQARGVDPPRKSPPARAAPR